MVAAKLVVAFFIAPGNTERRDHRAGIGFVLVREQQIDATLEKLGIVGSGRQRKSLGCSLPLMDEGLAYLLEWNA